MAKIGMPYNVIAPIATETEGSAVTYGTPAALEKPISANLTMEHADNPLWGGDVIAENDNEITGGMLALNLTDMTDAQQVIALGLTASGSDYEETNASAPYVGYGYVRVKKLGNVLSYIGYWIHKVQFALKSEEAKTKAGATEWQTPTVEGRIFGTYPDSTRVAKFRRHREYSAYADAKAWVDSIAGIPVDVVATPTADPAAGAVASATPIVLATATSGATIYYTTDGSTPTTGSMVYTAGIPVYAATTIKAIAAKTGLTNSGVLSSAYTISG